MESVSESSSPGDAYKSLRQRNNESVQKHREKKKKQMEEAKYALEKEKRKNNQLVR